MAMRVRGGIVSVVTKVENYISEMSSESLDMMSGCGNLQGQIDLVMNMKTKFIGTQMEIINAQTDTARKQHEEKQLADFIQRCDNLVTQIRDIMAEYPGTAGQSSSLEPSSDSNNLADFLKDFLTRSQAQHKEQMELLVSKLALPGTIIHNDAQFSPATTKLPQQNLPSFDGKYGNWISLRDSFKSAVIDYPNLTNVQKLNYLKTCVTGDAASTIKQIKVTDSNFEVAWNLLTKRFERDSDIVSDHVRAFYKMPKRSPTNRQAIHQINNIYRETLMALDSMTINQRDALVIQFTLDSLEDEDRILWGRQMKGKLGTAEEFAEFLTQLCIDEQNSSSTSSQVKPNNNSNPNRTHQNKSFKRNATALSVSGATLCRCCNEANHPLYRCQRFISLPGVEKFNVVKTLKLCRNCLSSHMTNSCTFHKCKRCQGRHNVLLHDYFASIPAPTNTAVAETQPVASTSAQSVPSSSTTPSTVAIASSSCYENQPPKVFLATAMVDILSASREKIPCRMVMDSGAQLCVMTTSLYQQLKLPKLPTNLTVLGVGAQKNTLRYRVQATIISQWTGESFSFDCYVMPKITGNIPNWDVDESLRNLPHGKNLADPQWFVSKPVDLLLSGDPYHDSWLHDTFRFGPGLPRLNETAFGWVVVGEHKSNSLRCDPCSTLSVVSLSDILRKIYDFDDEPDEMSITDEQKAAELHFVTTHKRTPEGRFLVQLPFKKDAPKLGDSRPQAIRQFLALERQFDKKPALKALYKDVMDDYMSKGWLEPAPERPTDVSSAYYMPHHGVLKDSVTTKLRVVYNASAKTSTGVSLNDILMVGPTVQPELIVILLKFRLHPFALIADISKMYLQLELDHAHRDYQRLVWRDSKDKPIIDLRINQVCFGVKPSGFLATRALVQLSEEHKESHPLASSVLRECFYVDDCVVSTNSIDAAKQMQVELVEVLKSAGFILTKWMSNSEFLTPLHSPDATKDSVVLNNPITTVLGLTWNSQLDTFHFATPFSPSDVVKSKRDMASAIAKLFDPIGMVGPVIMEAKILLQDLHRVKASWDAPLPAEYVTKWTKFAESLKELETISIPRWISCIANPYQVDLHVFCDASSKAYGTVVFMITRDRAGNVCSRNLTSKSRVAPLKKCTIPRLELCGALEGSQLTEKLQPLFNPNAVTYWTDSSIVLCWLNTPPDSYKVFVANRITKINSLTQASQWRHVPTKDNPADIISRGCTPDQLAASSLWWTGPQWLTLDRSEWPTIFTPINNVQAQAECLTISVDDCHWHDALISNMSWFSRVKRVMAKALRFAYNAMPGVPNREGPITVEELEQALLVLIYVDQNHYFPGVKDHIRNGTLSKSKWKCLTQLAPFIDDKDMIRVGGHLQNSLAQYSTKHPLLLPNSKLTLLLMRTEHWKQIHAGPSLLLATIRQNYWPLHGRRLAGSIVSHCVTCVKARPSPLTQFMGNLPAHRVELTRAFHATGVDFAGPLMIRASALRNKSSRAQPNVKCYIAVFICMATKAVHLEAVPSLSTEKFLESFRRFVSRRGKPRHVYSDRGRNFEGAANELERLLAEENEQRAITDDTKDDGIIWHFNPPSAPHHGGLWEAAVKSVKYHLYRVTETSSLTYDELSTLLCQIEAVLNSRPLCKMSEDPNDGEILTPGHFLTPMSAVNSLPDPRIKDIPENRLSAWQLVQARTQLFAERWRIEYLNTLQQRSRWTNPKKNIQVGEVVMLLDETQKEGSKWVLGKVEKVLPGADGFVRVVYVRTAKGTYKRPITKLARLPIPQPEKDILDPRNRTTSWPSAGSVLALAVGSEEEVQTVDKPVYWVRRPNFYGTISNVPPLLFSP